MVATALAPKPKIKEPKTDDMIILDEEENNNDMIILDEEENNNDMIILDEEENNNDMLIPDEEQSGNIILLDLEDEKKEELESKLKDLLFEFYKEIEKTKNGKDNLEKINQIINKVNELFPEKDLAPELLELQKKYLSKIDAELEAIENKKQSTEKPQAINESSKSETIINIDLNCIDVQSILDLINKTNEELENGNPSKITAARGRLIKKLKKEKNNIDRCYQKVSSIIELSNMTKEASPSLEKIKAFLQQKGNEKYYVYFQNKLSSTEEIKAAVEELMNNKKIQQIVFLEDLLENELEKQRDLLNERYGKEFLDKKGNIPSLVTVLPKAISLSAKKVANTINELKIAKTRRKKFAKTLQTTKDFFGMVGTPALYIGKFAASNWYSIYMAYKGISNAKAQKEQEEKAKKEAEKAQKDAIKKAEERKKAMEEESKRLEEERLRLEQEAKAAAEAKAKAEAEAKAKQEAEAKALEKVEEKNKEESKNNTTQTNASGNIKIPKWHIKIPIQKYGWTPDEGHSGAYWAYIGFDENGLDIGTCPYEYSDEMNEYLYGR